MKLLRAGRGGGVLGRWFGIGIGIASVVGGACSGDGVVDPGRVGELAFTPARPDREPASEVPFYGGPNGIVQTAQARFPTGLDLHVKVIRRSCSPTEGVCHNQKEYPDLHTASNFLGAIGAPCNLQEGTREAIFDRCERPGDRMQFDTDAVHSEPVEIAWIEYVPGVPVAYSDGNLPDATSPGLHLVLADPIATDRTDFWARGRFIRTFVQASDPSVNPSAPASGAIVKDIAYWSMGTRWWVMDGGKRVMGEVAEWQSKDLEALLASGIVVGDPNRNGILGARVGDPVALLVPGDPETSYLVARLRGTMEGVPIPGTRMPLANQPLSADELLALFCFIEGIDGGGLTRLDGPIDYARCSYSTDPENLEPYDQSAPLTWEGQVGAIFTSNCGGCHDAETPSGALPLVGPEARAALLAASDEQPDLARVDPGHLATSYLWLKLTGDPSISGNAMPTSPVTGWRPLRASELATVRAWIEAGAP